MDLIPYGFLLACIAVGFVLDYRHQKRMASYKLLADWQTSRIRNLTLDIDALKIKPAPLHPLVANLAKKKRRR